MKIKQFHIYLETSKKIANKFFLQPKSQQIVGICEGSGEECKRNLAPSFTDTIRKKLSAFFPL